MIHLEYFSSSDFDKLIQWSGDEAFLLQWAGPNFHYPLTREQLYKYLEESNDMESSNKLIYKVIEDESNIEIGHISLGGIDRNNRSGRIGRVLIGDDINKGKGYGSEMIKHIMNVGFGELNLHRISLGVFDFNHSAIRCYERAGFKCEGILRDARKFKDEYWNLLEMSILEDEWKDIYCK